MAFHICFLASFGSLSKKFQRRRFVFKLINQKKELPMVAMLANGLGQNEQSL
jgi:hypothetical protein